MRKIWDVNFVGWVEALKNKSRQLNMQWFELELNWTYPTSLAIEEFRESEVDDGSTSSVLGNLVLTVFSQMVWEVSLLTCRGNSPSCDCVRVEGWGQTNPPDYRECRSLRCGKLKDNLNLFPTPRGPTRTTTNRRCWNARLPGWPAGQLSTRS